MICIKCHQEVPDMPFCGLCGAAQAPVKRSARKRGNGQGTVIKRGKTYTAVYNAASYYDEAQQKFIRKRPSKGGFATRREAWDYMPILKAQVEGTDSVDLDMTMIELYNQWKTQHENDVTASTMNCYKAAWKYYADIQLYKVKNVKTSTMQECLDSCGKGKRTQENMKALGTMLFRMAMSNDIVDKNYAEALIPRGEKQEPRQPFTDAELKNMWEVTKSPDYDFRENHIDLVLILCYTGFRIEELLSLTNESFHEETDWCYFVGGIKTDAGRDRVVGISPKILPLVKRHIKDGYIFSPNGKKVSARTFRETIYYPALDGAGIQRRVPHCCRHTFATLMKNVDASDKDKMAMIGHSSMSQTLEYTHEDFDGLKKITANL